MNPRAEPWTQIPGQAPGNSRGRGHKTLNCDEKALEEYNLPSGMYHYSLVTSKMTITKKMIYVK